MKPVQDKTGDPAIHPEKPWGDLRVFFAAFAALFLVGMLFRAAAPVDDAFITLRYADNLIHHGELFYNPGDRVEGYTSIGQLLLLAPLTLLPKRAAEAGAALLGVLAWAGVVALAWRHLKREGVKKAGAAEWFLLVYLTLCPPALFWSWSGMEPALFSLCWLAAWVAHRGEYENDRWPWRSGLLAFAAGLMHPEGVLVGLVLGLSWFIPYRREKARRGMVFLYLAWGLFGLYWLWRARYFHSFFPNTAYAKVSGSPWPLLQSGLAYIGRSALGAVLPFVGLFLVIRQRRTLVQNPRWFFLAIGLITALLLYVVRVGGDYFAFQRFLLPAYPFLLLTTWRLWRLAQADLESKNKGATAMNWLARAPWMSPLVGSVAALALCAWALFVPGLPIAQHRAFAKPMKDFKAVGRVFANTMPTRVRVATVPIGAFGFYSDVRLIDCLGLTDRHIAREAPIRGYHHAGHDKFDYEYVLGLQPEIIMQLPALFTKNVEGLRDWLQRTTVDPAQYDLYLHPGLDENYELRWFPIVKNRGPLAKRDLDRDVPLGVYAFVRKDRLAEQDYRRWQALPGDLARLPFEEYGRMIEANKDLFGKFKLGMWSFGR